jgi:hypothetical protein
LKSFRFVVESFLPYAEFEALQSALVHDLKRESLDGAGKMSVFERAHSPAVLD